MNGKVVKRPKRAIIGPFNYSIEFYTEKQWEEHKLPPDWGGYSGHEECIIGIRMTPGRSEDSMRETLLHELLHCVWVVTGLNHFRPDKKHWEEQIVHTQSPTLLRLMSDNPAVLAYLINLGGPV